MEIFSRDFYKLRFLSRLSRFVETGQDFQDLLRRSQDLSRNLDIVKAFWVWKWWKVLTDWEIPTRKYKNPRTSRLRSRQTVEKRQNFQILTNFSILIETFWSGHWCRDEIKKFRSGSRLFGLDIVVKTKSRSFNLDWDISIVETNFLTLLRFSQLSRLTL